MDNIEEEFTASNDHTQIVKRKRTKRRQRTGLVVTSSSSSGGSGAGGGGGGGGGYYSTPSPTTSSNFSANSEEDEDMANCLMLLSQSSAPMRHEREKKVDKLTNRKFTATVGASVATTGKGGTYVYECKTCNRTFPSFQALGGHRASHKKPKVAVPLVAVVEEKKSPIVLSDCKEEIFNHQFDTISDYIQPISVQRDDKAIIDSNNNKAKVHECSICGSEFSSGQALGGHMRRHRTPLVVAPEKPRRFLSLDLNLPAPEEDCRDSEFVFTPNHHQHNVVFSAPALVDCHY